MKNTIQKLKSVLAILIIAFSFSAFTVNDSREVGTHFTTGFTATQSGSKQFSFYASDQIHVYLTNASVVPVAVFAQCLNSREAIEPIVLLPHQTTITQPFFLENVAELPVMWVFEIYGEETNTSGRHQITVGFDANWLPI